MVGAFENAGLAERGLQRGCGGAVGADRVVFDVVRGPPGRRGLAGEQRGEDPVHADQVIDHLAYRPVRAWGRHWPLVGPDVADQAGDRVGCTAELSDQRRALGITALDAELVALRIGQDKPSVAVWPALIVNHPGPDAQELFDLIVAPGS